MSTTSKELLDILESLPPWPRFPNLTRDWSPQQIEARFPFWDLLAEYQRLEVPVLHPDVWIVYGEGAMALSHPGCPTPVGSTVGGSMGEKRNIVDRILCRPAQVLPPKPLFEALVQAWRARAMRRENAMPEIVVCNEIQERIAAVRPIVKQIAGLIEQAKREVRRVGGDPAFLDDLLHDPFIHDEYVDAAIFQLTKVVSPPTTRPAVISREYVLGLLSGILDPNLPSDLLPPLLDYLLSSGVIVRNGEDHVLAHHPTALRERPERAQEALRNAIADHAKADRHRAILRNIIKARTVGGAGSCSQGTGGTHGPDLRPTPPAVADYKWERADHVRAFAACGQVAAERLVDWVIATSIRNKNMSVEEQRKPAEARALLHDGVVGLADDLLEIVRLVQKRQLGDGLMWLEQHIDNSANPEWEPADEEARQWQRAISSTKAHLATARELWGQELPGLQATLRVDFDRVGRGEATCHSLYALTYHGLLIQLATIVLDPYSPGSVPDHALAAEGAGAPEGWDRHTLQNLVRRHVVEALASAPWWKVWVPETLAR